MTRRAKLLMLAIFFGAMSVLTVVLGGCGGSDVPGGPAFPEVNLASGNVVFDIPPSPASLNYVTMPSGPLTGKKLIRMKYRLDLAPGVKLIPSSDPNAPTIISLYFQRLGDDWTAQGGREAYRWYAAFANMSPIQAGEHTMEAPLDGAWSAVLTSTHANNPSGFQGAIDNTTAVGFVLGGGTGLGHGIYATGPAKLTVLSFEVV